MVYDILFALFFIIVFFRVGFNFYRGKYLTAQTADSELSTSPTEPSTQSLDSHKKIAIVLFLLGICTAILSFWLGWGSSVFTTLLGVSSPVL